MKVTGFVTLTFAVMAVVFVYLAGKAVAPPSALYPTD